MSYLIVLLVCGLFTIFFSLINLRYFGLLPVFFLIFFFSQGFYHFKFHIAENKIKEKYGLYGLALLVMLGLFGILTFIGLDNESAFWSLFILSIIARAASYIFNYQDGKELFKYGIITLSGLIVFNHIISSGSSGLLSQIGWVIGGLLMSFTIIYYGVGAYFEVEKEQYYSHILLIIIMSIRIIFALQESTMYGFTFGLINITFALLLLNYAFNYTSPIPRSKRQLSLRRILAGEKILQKEKPDPLLRRKTFIQKIKDSPKFLHRGLEYLNLFLLAGVIISYLLPLFGGTPFHYIRYWTGIVLFTINAFLLKKTQAFSITTRFAFSFVLNFSLYISILLLGGNDINNTRQDLQTAIPWLIMRNFLCGIIVLYANQPPLSKYLFKSDLIFWEISSLMAMLLNIYLIGQLPYAGQLAFSLIFVYLGIQGTITYYGFQVIKKHQTPINTTTPLTGIFKTPDCI